MKESHLSCQIQLCAPLASKRREIFHCPHFSVGFSFVLYPSYSFRCLSVTPLMFIPFSPPSCYCPLFCFCSLWVWLKVILHTGSLSERRERGRKKDRRRTAEEGEGQPGGQAVHSTVQSSLFASDMIGEVWKDTWGCRLSQEC